jgi:cytochrome oxidase assembly protein ShyY1
MICLNNTSKKSESKSRRSVVKKAFAFVRRLSIKQSILVLILLGLMAITLWAGKWQWQRAQYHDALLKIALAKQAQSIPALDLNRMTTPQFTGQLLRVSGTWLADSTTYVSPRIMDGVRGAWAISVLQYLDAQGEWHFMPVHRGWVPQTHANQPPELPSLIGGNVVLQGEFVDKLPQSFELGKPDLSQLGLWPNYSVSAHAAIVNKPLQPYILVLAANTGTIDRDASVLRRVSLQTASEGFAEKAAKNRAYMVQWLGLCLVLVLGSLVLWRRRLK